jgi:hypothetical protein
MSTNYTEHYNLCQWEPADKVLREDFNADNAKLDAALAAQQTAIEKAQADVDAAYRPAFPPVVTGCYSGSGAASATIRLGFRPRAVLVLPNDFLLSGFGSKIFYRAGAAMEGFSFISSNPVVIIDDGFQVFHDTVGNITRETNLSGARFFYLAVR